MIERRKSRPLRVGDVQVGGGATISIQSMCTTDTRDADATLLQIQDLAASGCDIVRVAVPDRTALVGLRAICATSPLPVVADVHFDFRLARDTIPAGVAGLRYNPGNIGSPRRVQALARAAADASVPIRIGVNAASLAMTASRRHGAALAEALVDSALGHAALLEEVGFFDIKLSLKASDVQTTIAAYRLCAGRCDYPLHLGLTEAGTLVPGAVRSALALGILLAEGIGDTVRVSLAADPTEEVWVARQLLQSLGLRRDALELVACPRCGRCTVDVHGMAQRVERRLRHITTHIRVAVMGCEVNGPGEARHADVGLAGAAGQWVLFAQGSRVLRIADPTAAEQALVDRVLSIAGQRSL